VSGSAFAALIGLSMMWSPAVRDMAQDKAAKPEASAN